MKRYTINYEETYSGTFTVELNDDSTEQDAINELLNNADEYRLGEQVELSDSDAQVIKTENVEGLTDVGRTLHRLPIVERLDCRRPEGMELTK